MGTAITLPRWLTTLLTTFDPYCNHSSLTILHRVCRGFLLVSPLTKRFSPPFTSRSNTFCQAWPCAPTVFDFSLQFQKLKSWNILKNSRTCPIISHYFAHSRVNIHRFCSLISPQKCPKISTTLRVLAPHPAWRSSMFACTFRMRSFNPPPIFPKTLTLAEMSLGWQNSRVERCGKIGCRTF